MSAFSDHLNPTLSKFALSLFSLLLYVIDTSCLVYTLVMSDHISVYLAIASATTAHSFLIREQRMSISIASSTTLITIFRDARAFHRCSSKGRQTDGLDHALLLFTFPALKQHPIVGIYARRTHPASKMFSTVGDCWTSTWDACRISATSNLFKWTGCTQWSLHPGSPISSSSQAPAYPALHTPFAPRDSITARSTS
jgi:hypothetical protein